MKSQSDDATTNWSTHREYLYCLARQQVDAHLQTRIDLSGVVQQTLLDAHQAGEKLTARSEYEQAAWLRKALANNLADEFRKLHAKKRGEGLERSLQEALDQSSARLQAWVATEQSTPSEKAIRHEQVVGLTQALAQLPENQRRAVESRHLKGLPLSEIALELQTTKSAVVGLLHRGMKRLHELLVPPEET